MNKLIIHGFFSSQSSGRTSNIITLFEIINNFSGREYEN